MVAPLRSSSRSTECIASVTSGSDEGQSIDSLMTATRRPRTSVTRASAYGAVSIAPRTHCGSRGSSPAMASRVSAVSRTVRAVGQMKSMLWSRKVIPKLGTSPWVGFIETTPHQEPGMRALPPSSTPSEMSTSPAATAAPLPPEEPPAERVGS